MNVNKLRLFDFSKLHPYAIGIVVEDNLDNNKVIKAYPIEKFYVDDNYQPTSFQPYDPNKQSILFNYKQPKIIMGIKLKWTANNKSIKTDYQYYIIATWKTKNNRVTPPNVCKGEKVLLWRYSNTDLFFWEEFLTNLDLRKEEHVEYRFSDKSSMLYNQEENQEDPNDMYTITISPKTKTIKLHTTDKYGEYTTYDITIKTDEGYIELIDGKGNYIKLDSQQDLLDTNINDTIHYHTQHEKRDIDQDITVNTTNETRNIKENLKINLDKISIKNSTTELIGLLCEYIETHIQESHIGNMGIPTKLTSEFQSKYQDILSKLQTLKI